MNKAIFLIAASVTLAGCGTLPTNTSLYSVHQPIVERTNHAIDLASDSSGIASADQVRLNDWFDVLGLGYGDRISIDHGNAYVSSDAARDVAAAAARRGMMVADTAPTTPGVIPAIFAWLSRGRRHRFHPARIGARRTKIITMVATTATMVVLPTPTLRQ